MKFKEIGFFPSSSIWKQTLATLASCLICLSTGISFGITAMILPQLRVGQSITYNPDHETWIASISILSVPVGSLFSGQILDSYGRRAAHIILGLPFIIGWIIIACANSTGIIIFGRFMTGLSAGANKIVTTVYISEITEPKLRPITLLMPSLTKYIGQLLSHAVGYYLYWKTSAIICIFPAITSVIAFLLLKESPLWLIAKGRTDEGIQNFRWFRGTNTASDAELETILAKQSEKPKMSVKETFKIVRTKSFIKPMLIVIVVLCSVQSTGITAITYYSIDIFRKVFKGNVDPLFLTIVMDIVAIIVTLGFCAVNKLISRRIAFICSNFCCSISVLGLVTCVLIPDSDVTWVCVLCLIVYFCFANAIGTIGWTFVPELLPTSARGLGSGLNSASTALLLFALVKTTPTILESYGEVVLFALYGIFTFSYGLVLCFILPETNAKTLQCIEDTFKPEKVSESTI